MKIIRFNEKYRDDLIFMILLTKEKMGYPPHISELLLDIPTHYADGAFFLAVDGARRVVGSLGVRPAHDRLLYLHHFYVKPGFQRGGIGTSLLEAADAFAGVNGYSVLRAKFAYDFRELMRFCPKNGLHEVTSSVFERPVKPRTVHTMHLDLEHFAAAAEGRKSIECRLADEKRRAVCVGDIIRFIERSPKERLFHAFVTDIEPYSDFDSLLSMYDLEELGYPTGDRKLRQSLRSFYGDEAEQRNGVLAFRFVGLDLKEESK